MKPGNRSFRSGKTREWCVRSEEASGANSFGTLRFRQMRRDSDRFGLNADDCPFLLLCEKGLFLFIPKIVCMFVKEVGTG